MFRQKKIRKFIEKYGWELADNNFEELEIFLNNVGGFQSVMRKINKLSKRDQEYVISSINSCKKYDFNEEELGLILNTKLNYMKKNKKKGFKHLDFDRIYYAFKPNEEFFRYYISEYQKSKLDTTSCVNLGSYYGAINIHYNEFNKLFKGVIKSANYEKLNNYMFALPPRFLCLFFEEMEEKGIPMDLQKLFFDYIVNNERMFDKLSVSEFRDILEFIFNVQDASNSKEVLDKKLDAVKEFKEEMKNDWCYLNAFSNLTDEYIIGIFKEDSIAYDLNFLSLLKEVSNHTKCAITSFIKDVNSHYNDGYYKLLNSEAISRLSDNTIEYILKEIEKIKDEEYSNRMEIIDGIMSCAVLDDEVIIKKALDFIGEEKDDKLLSTKINCIKRIIPHVYEDIVSFEGYERYFELLSDGLEGKSVEEKISILETKSSFIEKNNVYENMNDISKKAFRLLNEESNRNSDVYSFINNASSNYSSTVVEKVVDNLANLTTSRDKELFVDFVVDEFFVSSDKKRQETLLELFDNKKVTIDFSENVEGTLSVSPYIHNIIDKSNSPMEFVNKDTGIKIFVKTTKKD